MAKFSIIAIALTLLLVAASASLVDAKRPKWNELDNYNFDAYVSDFGRGYVKGSEEYKHREAIFNRRLRIIREHNADARKSWRRGVNQFSDMSDVEWKQFNRAYKHPNRPKPLRVVEATQSQNEFPVTIDWRLATSPRVLTAIKHQGSCGSCWAHSATETIEAYYALATGMLPVLSQQQITSCVTECYGCGGGDPAMGYAYINSTFHGLTEEWAYPYTDFFFNYRDPNATTSACVNTTEKFPNKVRPYSWFAELNRAGVNGYVSVSSNNATATQQALAQNGPLAILVAAGNWQDYESGIFTNIDFFGHANEWQIDHAVQMVGYGFDGDSNMNYWIVRNSWSTLWGEDGYIRLFRAANPADEPCSPPEFGPVCGTSGTLYDNTFPDVYQQAGQKF